MNDPGPVTLRVNLIRPPASGGSPFCRGAGTARPGAHSPWALHVEGRANLFGSRLWREGHFEVQDEGSQLVALQCAVRPGEKVVDYCAGAGGKALALAAAMGCQGELWALDVDPGKLRQLAVRVTRAGAASVRSALAVVPGHPPAPCKRTVCWPMSRAPRWERCAGAQMRAGGDGGGIGRLSRRQLRDPREGERARAAGRKAHLRDVHAPLGGEPARRVAVPRLGSALRPSGAAAGKWLPTPRYGRLFRRRARARRRPSNDGRRRLGCPSALPSADGLGSAAGVLTVIRSS